MRWAALACFLLLLSGSLERAWAEGARVPRGGWTVSEREQQAEGRSRAATAAICQGCTGRTGLQPSRIEGANSRLVGKRSSREAGRRASMAMTRVWTPVGALPLTSSAEAQLQETNRFIAIQQQLRQHQQQTQFELNQLRSELQRAYPFRSWAGPSKSCSKRQVGSWLERIDTTASTATVGAGA